MTTALRKKNQLLLAKVETTYDTDAAPSASTDSILAIDPKIKETVDPVRRPAQIGSLSRLASVAGSKYAEVTFSVELKGSGSAGTAPRVGALLRACGFSAAVVSNTSVTYTPVSSSFDSVTIWLYIDGRVHKLTGCRGDVKIKCEAGQMAMAEFTLQGRYADPTLLALASPTLESTTPAVCKSCVFTYNSRTSLVVKSAQLEMNNTVAKRPSLSDANAIVGFEITDRDPMLTIDPEAIIETSYNFRSDALGGNLRQVSWVVGATAGNICTFTIPKWNPYWPEYEDRDEILVEKIKGECTQNTGNDEVSIAFT
jgi:hypothetical protein